MCQGGRLRCEKRRRPERQALSLVVDSRRPTCSCMGAGDAHAVMNRTSESPAGAFPRLRPARLQPLQTRAFQFPVALLPVRHTIPGGTGQPHLGLAARQVVRRFRLTYLAR
jgi:hypothetical protein